MRASIVVLGPILARRPCQSFYARGCTIGSRPIDLHLKGLEAMGQRSPDSWLHRSQGRTPAWRSYHMDFPSVGATQNLVMAATLADGVTVIENAA